MDHHQSDESDSTIDESSLSLPVDVETPSVPCHVDCHHRSSSGEQHVMDDECSRTSCTTRSSSSSSSRNSSASQGSDDDDDDDMDEHDDDYDSDVFADERVPLHLPKTTSAVAITTTRSIGGAGPLSLRVQQQCGKLLFGTVGIYVAYLSYGMIQEDLYRYKRVVVTVTNGTDDGDGDNLTTTTIVFTSVWFLQVLESSASIIMGYLGRQWESPTTTPLLPSFARNSSSSSILKAAPVHRGDPSGRLQSIRPFLWSGTTQVLAKVFMSWSLVAGASYPVATLAKSAKVVPVMLGQCLLGGSTYGRRDSLFAVLVVLGTVLLSLGGRQQHTSSVLQPPTTATTTTTTLGDSGDDTYVGMILIVLSLVMDGLTGGLQKQLLRDMAAAPPSTYDFCLYSHLAMVWVALVVSVLTGDLERGLTCLGADAQILRMVASLCMLSMIGQYFIFYVIRQYDPLVCATITTTRKIGSVLLSIVFHGHALSATGYAGLALAVSGLLIEVQGKCTTATASTTSTTLLSISSAPFQSVSINGKSNDLPEREQQRLLPHSLSLV
jgi:solute carrier family 35 (UDP-galactose transporter), member B1